MTSRAPVCGQVVWITGLSGAGKSTVARRVVDMARQAGANVVLLDGDQFRAAVGDGAGHGREARLENAYRLARFARLLSLQGVDVVCATMSLFREIHDWNRRHLPRYFEVYLRVPLEVLEERDPKGIYARARAGREKGVVGLDLRPDEPLDAHLVIDNGRESLGPSAVAALVLAAAGYTGGPLGDDREGLE